MHFGMIVSEVYNLFAFKLNYFFNKINKYSLLVMNKLPSLFILISISVSLFKKENTGNINFVKYLYL